MRGALILGVLVLGCGSAEAPSGFSVSSPESDGGIGSAGSGAGGTASGGAVSSGGTAAVGGVQSAGGTPSAGGAAGSAGAAACVNTECSDSLNGCCAGADCVPGIGAGVGRCMPYCATDADCPSGWGCTENTRGCGKFAPAWACTAQGTELTCAPPCATDTDCGNGACVTFWGTRYSLGGSSTNWGPCPLTPRNFCAVSELRGVATKCPG